MGDSWKIASRCRRNQKIRTTYPTDVGFWQTDWWLQTCESGSSTPFRCCLAAYRLWLASWTLFAGYGPANLGDMSYHDKRRGVPGQIICYDYNEVQILKKIIYLFSSASSSAIIIIIINSIYNNDDGFRIWVIYIKIDVFFFIINLSSTQPLCSCRHKRWQNWIPGCKPKQLWVMIMFN